MGLIQVRVRREKRQRKSGRASERKQGVPGAGGVCVIYLICVYIFIFALVFSVLLLCADVSGDRRSVRVQVHSVQFNIVLFFNHPFSTSHFALEKLLCLFFFFVCFLLMFKYAACNRLTQTHHRRLQKSERQQLYQKFYK